MYFYHDKVYSSLCFKSRFQNISRSLEVYLLSLNYAPYLVEYIHWILIQIFFNLGVFKCYQYNTLQLYQLKMVFPIINIQF